jgi:hypothetical protein
VIVLGYWLPFVPRVLLRWLQGFLSAELFRSPRFTPRQKAWFVGAGCLANLLSGAAVQVYWLITGRGPYRPSKEVYIGSFVSRTTTRQWSEELIRPFREQAAEMEARVEDVIRGLPGDAFTVDDLDRAIPDLFAPNIETILERFEKRGSVARPAPGGRTWLRLAPLRSPPAPRL